MSERIEWCTTLLRNQAVRTLAAGFSNVVLKRSKHGMRIGTGRNRTGKARQFQLHRSVYYTIDCMNCQGRMDILRIARFGLGMGSRVLLATLTRNGGNNLPHLKPVCKSTFQRFKYISCVTELLNKHMEDACCTYIGLLFSLHYQGREPRCALPDPRT